MGIVVAACLASEHGGQRWDNKQIDFELHELGYEAWGATIISLSIAVLNQNVFPLDITKIAQSLPKGTEQGTRRGRSVARYITYEWDFLRLLRVGYHCKSKQHRCNQD